MTIPKNPLFGFSAKGTLGKALSFRGRGSQTIAEKKPIPEDAKSLAQLSWRHMYQKALALWHALSADEKQEWETNARPRHMTGFAWFMSQCLRPNPGIYLPLQGGTMQGDIDMDGHDILNLPAPPNKEIFLPACAGAFTSGSCSTDISPWPVAKGLANSAQPDFRVSTKVPPDFSALVSVKALWESVAASGYMYWRFWCSYAAEGQMHNVHTDNTDLGRTATAGAWKLNVQESDDPLTLPGITPNDFLGLRFDRQGANPLDNLEEVVYVHGLLITYTPTP